jgi:hypothetical protein
MGDKIGGTVVRVLAGFVLGITLTTLNSCDITSVDVMQVNDSIKMCKDSHPVQVDIGTLVGGYYHATTTVFCANGEIIEIAHKK